MRRLFLILCFVLTSHASELPWRRSLGGEIPHEYFSAITVGTSAPAEGDLIDARGRFFVMADRLAVFDGASWSTFAAPGATGLRSLCLGSDGKLWAGAINELGYFSETAEGRFEYHSLRQKLPNSVGNLQDVWGCTEAGGKIYFVAATQVLSWDGNKFDVQPFPTSRRLFPVRIGSELYFTHHESGFYRIGAAGPGKIFVPDAMPRKAAFWGERRDDSFLLASSAGIFKAGEPTTPISDTELTAFLAANYVLDGVRLPSGELALATLGGIAIVSPDLRTLERVLSVAEGLPSNDIRSLHLDEANRLWVVTSDRGVFRIAAENSAALFPVPASTAHRPTVDSVTVSGTKVVALAETGLSALDLSAPRASLVSVAGEIGKFRQARAIGDGIAMTGFAQLGWFDGRASTVLFSSTGSTFFDAVSSASDAGAIYVLDTYRLTRVERSNTGAVSTTVAQLSSPADQLVADARGGLWINSPTPQVVTFDPTTRAIATLSLPCAPNNASRGTHLLADGDRVFVFYGADVFVAEAGSQKFTRVASLPVAGNVRASAFARGENEIFALVEVSFGNRKVVELCSLALPADGARWRVWDVPALQQVGYVTSLAVDQVGGDLWVGTERGLLRIDPAVLRERLPLSAVQLRASDLPAARAVPFNGHRISLFAYSPDWGRRREIAFQTRMRTHGIWSDWSSLSTSGRFTLQNLADGEHEFAVRTIDAVGQIGEEARVTFRVLPPLWRSPFALAAYVCAFLVTGLVTLRLRERSVRRRNEELERIVAERTVELRKANAAKDDFLSSMSHEIRNPLNGVVGLAAAINPATLEPQTRLKFEYLQHCATHLAGLLEDILDFSQIEAGAVTLNPQPFELAKSMQAIAAITAAQSAKAGRRVDIQVAPNVPPFLVGDAARIRQTIINLVINALKYGERGDVQLTVWARQSVPDRCTVTFAVSDEGPGIAPEELSQLFTRFTRGEAARRTRTGGSGIGLAISRALAEKMGGRLWAESEVGHGSTFHLELPFDVARTAAEQSAALEPWPTWNALIVDDEDYNRLALESLLETVGIKFTSVAHGEAALAAAARESFDVIFLDYDLPGLTGPEIARALRAESHRCANAIIVAITAFVTREKHEECRRAGMNAVITKPVTADKLRGALAGAAQLGTALPTDEGAAGAMSDPLGALRLLAERKQTSFAEERDRFAAALAEDLTELEKVFARREAHAAAHVAHRLVGRLAYIQAATAERFARDLEAALLREDWAAAESLWSTLSTHVETIRANLREAR